MKFIKIFFMALVFFLFAFITHNIWFSPTSIISFSDWYYWPHIAVKEMLYSWLSWNGYFNFGAPNIQLPFIGFTSIWSLIVSMGSNFNLAAKVTFFIPISIFGFLSPFFFVYYLTKNKLIAFVSSIFYASSSYFLIQQAGEPPIAMVYALAPLIYLLFIRALNKNNFLNWFYFIFLYITGIFYEVRIMYILTIVFIFHFFFFNIKQFKNYIFNIIFVGSILMFMNLFWILPVLFGGISHQIGTVTGRGLFGATLSNIMYAVTTFHWSWTGGYPNENFYPQNIIWYFWIIPILIFSLLLTKKNKYRKETTFFLFISLLGILITKQSAPPFSPIYIFLYKHLPGFSLFREASKFYLVIELGYLGILAYGSLALKTSNKKLFVAYIVIILFVSFINFIPLINGSIRTLFVNRVVPNDYKIAEKYITNQKSYFRTMWIPVYSRWSFFDDKNPEMNTINVIQQNWSSIAAKQFKDKEYKSGRQVIIFLSNKSANNLVNNSSIKYIFVPLEDKANDDDFFSNYGEPRQYYINALDKISWLKRINIGTKALAVYENPTYRPHIYTTQEKETITKDVPYQKIKYAFINPTEYTLTLSHVKNPLYVNFSEAYNANWKMHVGNFNWWSVLTNKNYFLPDNWHFQNDATLNSFYVEPKTICSSSYKVRNVYNVNGGGCMKNSDGTYTIHATLYFIPQSYMDFGLIVSGTTLAGILGYLGFVGVNFVRRKYAKEN